MRLDFYHSGTDSDEFFSVDRVVIEPLPWPGHPGRRLDDTNLGKYYFEVIDLSSNRVLYSRGFASIFGEWETIAEAGSVHRTFHESLRFPEPPGPARIALKKRDRENVFREVWVTTVDPSDHAVDTARLASPGPLIEIQKSGDSAEKVDLLLLGDGYASGEIDKCRADALRLTETLFGREPFRQDRSEFNVWALCPASLDSGVSRPSEGIHKTTALEATYDFFGSERYLMTLDNRTFRELASFAPYEFAEILVNSRTYGGGGIFGLYATVAVDNHWAPYVFVHEFGHHFAGLADEYYTSEVAYEPPSVRVEPWEPNVTALLDPAHMKWNRELSEGVPIPTPWNKDAFERHSTEIQQRRRQIRAEKLSQEEMESLFEEQRKWETEHFAAQEYNGKVGAFEGAMYEAEGYYRPQLDCVMFSRNHAPFCRVCQRAIRQVIDLYTGP